MYCEFHVLLDYIMFLASISSFVGGLVVKKPAIWAGGIAGFFLYPVALEILVYGWAFITHSQRRYKEKLIERKNKMGSYLPIIYHKKYNLTACGLENLHPFDAIKYGR